MKSPSSSLARPSASNAIASLISAFISIAILSVLILWLPYATGYGFHRVSLTWYLSSAWSGEDWQHCWLVGPAIAFIVYHFRSRLASIPLSGHWSGLCVAMLALLIYWAGYKVENLYFGYAAVQLLVAGLIIWLAGWKWMKILAFPWMFMVFLWPLMFLDNVVAFPLRIVMSKASVGTLNFIGVPVVLQGTGILSAGDALTGLKPGQRFSVDVADPCSGIRSLFALLMVSALYAHFTLKTWWQKWILFLCAVPLAVLGNLVRILMLTFGVMSLGPEIAIGSLEKPSAFHMGAGYVVFAVALAGMVGIGWLLGRAGETDLSAFFKRRAAARAARPSLPVPPKDGRDESRNDDVY